MEKPLDLAPPRLTKEERDRTETRAYAELFNKLVPQSHRLNVTGSGISTKQAKRLGFLVKEMRDGRARAAVWMLKRCLGVVKRASCHDEAVALLEDELQAQAEESDGQTASD